MALYRVTSEHYVKQWKDMLVSSVFSDPVVAPSVGDYFRVVLARNAVGAVWMLMNVLDVAVG